MYISDVLVSKSNLCLQGTESELAGKSAACAGCENQAICASGTTKLPDPALPLIKQRMDEVRRKILILSGKGGVGKSTFTAQLGWAFAADEDVQVRIISSGIPDFSKSDLLAVCSRRGSWMLIFVALQYLQFLALLPSRSIHLLPDGHRCTFKITWLSCPSDLCSLHLGMQLCGEAQNGMD